MLKLLVNLILLSNLLMIAYSQFSLPQRIKDELFLHNSTSFNTTSRDCTWRPSNDKQVCPDPAIRFIFYNSEGEKRPVDFFQSDWLRHSGWDGNKEDVFIVHGYAGGDDTLPIVVLRDAYINNGSYNVWMVDWGQLCPPPCYPAAVHNMKAVAKCTAELLTVLRSDGLRTDRMACVGHSLGGHICGLVSRHVLFRMHRIVALDPARPLVPLSSRLSSGDASAVHVLHTNAGHYGEAGRAGHVDFCINGGRVQPYCENSGIDEQLCSHVWAICYMAESISAQSAKLAEPCSRRCPAGPRPGHRIGVPVLMGQHTPLTTVGSYCMYDKKPPFCPSQAGDPGDKRCCLKPINPDDDEIRKKYNQIP